MPSIFPVGTLQHLFTVQASTINFLSKCMAEVLNLILQAACYHHVHYYWSYFTVMHFVWNSIACMWYLRGHKKRKLAEVMQRTMLNVWIGRGYTWRVFSLKELERRPDFISTRCQYCIISMLFVHLITASSSVSALKVFVFPWTSCLTLSWDGREQLYQCPHWFHVHAHAIHLLFENHQTAKTSDWDEKNGFVKNSSWCVVHSFVSAVRFSFISVSFHFMDFLFVG